MDAIHIMGGVRPWMCPSQEHDRVLVSADKPAPACPLCGATMVDPSIFQDRAKPPPLPAAGWIWNERRGPFGLWERFDPNTKTVVDRSELAALADALAPHLDSGEHIGVTLLEGARRVLTRIAPNVAEGDLVQWTDTDGRLRRARLRWNGSHFFAIDESGETTTFSHFRGVRVIERRNDGSEIHAASGGVIGFADGAS